MHNGLRDQRSIPLMMQSAPISRAADNVKKALVRPELFAEVTFLAWIGDGLPLQVG